MEHSFKGKWITDSEFSSLPPRNVFFRQLERINLPCNEHRNRHILFRKKFNCTAVSNDATDNGFLYDFGSNYVGYLRVTARGKKGDVIGIRCAQELNDGSPRYKLRANCCYNEEWVLSDGECTLDWFDYKSFRYAELSLPEGVEILDVSFLSKHYPFELKAAMKPEFESDPEGKRIWELCVHSLEYGVQEVIQDCMEREKGFYLGDGCYTALAHMVLTKDDSMVRRLIDDAFASEFITDTLMTCMNCSFMQEIAEYPLILALLLLWHYRFTDDREYLVTNLKRITKVLDGYRRDYEKDGLLRDVNKFCVVEWPQNFRHGYDVDIVEGKVCHEAHVSLSSYYLAAINTVNKIAAILGQPEYRNIAPLIETFNKAFFKPEKHLFKDGENTEHICLVGNSFVYGFGLCDDPGFDANFMSMLKEKGIDSLSFFCIFPVFMGLVRDGRFDTLRECILHEGTWKRMLREGATTTFEGWGKDTKWNTSLFHLTMSYAAIFMADIDLQKLFG